MLDTRCPHFLQLFEYTAENPDIKIMKKVTLNKEKECVIFSDLMHRSSKAGYAHCIVKCHYNGGGKPMAEPQRESKQICL
jgi:hypothetical protein